MSARARAKGQYELDLTLESTWVKRQREGPHTQKRRRGCKNRNRDRIASMFPGRPTSRGRTRKQTEGDESMDDDVRSRAPEEEQDEQRLTTGIDEKSLKAAVWYTVAQIAQEEEVELGRSMSEPFVAALTELVYAQAEHLALELKAFAAHAGRSTIREEDVKLACRKSSVLQELLDEEARRTIAGGSTSTKAITTGPTKNAATATKKSKPKPTRVGSSAAVKSSARPPAD
ncbi:hypothetical protein PCANC_25742 [Puccinia coronata f. sp. avenae]|uniref:Centromere protein S n=1 Tax=Puccinia coronata f. sp. avenae TaxID=200324 RepID=A0A2N5S3U4_9BASI|nr:hypothetical protein PCANC_25742 [Puccinia coronata f. sp. avenae]